MGTSEGASPEILGKRLARERKARAEAEAIAEKVTTDLYGAIQELRDVNDELAAMNVLMREFVSIASHDLKTPLTAIIGFSGAMLQQWDSLDDADKIDFLGRIERSGRQLDRLVDDVLAVSRIEAGALDTRARVVKLREVFEEAVGVFTDHANDICLTCPDDALVLADPDHVERIVVNYITNAFKYGRPPVELEALLLSDSVEIRVRDRGDGVPKEFLSRLFGRFERADTQATRQEKGTGLGLSIVKGLAQANGGDAWYEPNDPSGSCFVVRLPRAVAA